MCIRDRLKFTVSLYWSDEAYRGRSEFYAELLKVPNVGAPWRPKVSIKEAVSERVVVAPNMQYNWMGRTVLQQMVDQYQPMASETHSTLYHMNLATTWTSVYTISNRGRWSTGDFPFDHRTISWEWTTVNNNGQTVELNEIKLPSGACNILSNKAVTPPPIEESILPTIPIRRTSDDGARVEGESEAPQGARRQVLGTRTSDGSNPFASGPSPGPDAPPFGRATQTEPEHVPIDKIDTGSPSTLFHKAPREIEPDNATQTEAESARWRQEQPAHKEVFCAQLQEMLPQEWYLDIQQFNSNMSSILVPTCVSPSATVVQSFTVQRRPSAYVAKYALPVALCSLLAISTAAVPITVATARVLVSLIPMLVVVSITIAVHDVSPAYSTQNILHHWLFLQLYLLVAATLLTLYGFAIARLDKYSPSHPLSLRVCSRAASLTGLSTCFTTPLCGISWCSRCSSWPASHLPRIWRSEASLGAYLWFTTLRSSCT
eukprot:TRINITY_DN10750_c0_g1_i5.p1 TRINITY_DN10750_c0_g1~~TRINITY_DN10750_c0_g1_i5.p1  ORF type:complete len:488 (+),score=58.70 TRINITY_DN10750_c0_g1_i5:112-1575(+)